MLWFKDSYKKGKTGLEGFEPSTDRLRADCSSLAELQAHNRESISSNNRYYLGLPMENIHEGRNEGFKKKNMPIHICDYQNIN